MSNDLKKLSVLLVSSKTTHRAGLRKMLCDMGFDNHYIEVASDYNQAVHRLEKSPIHVLITDDDVGDKASPLDIIPLHSVNNPHSKNRYFILMLGDTDPFQTSQFILQGGDLIVEKPFTNEIFSRALHGLLKSKGALTFDEGLSLDIQDLLKSKDFNRAKEAVASFKDQDSQAALFTQGLIYQSENDFSKASQAYSKAIAKKVDLKTLVNFLHTGVQAQKFAEVGQYIERWIRDYPIHNKSVPDITRVVLYNKKFYLLDELSETVTRTNLSDNLVKFAISAGLVVAASQYLDEGDTDRAIDYALKGIEFSSFKTSILIRGLDILVKSDASEEAEKIYRMLNTRAPYSDNPILNIRMQEVIYPKAKVLESCMTLISNNIIDADIFQVALNCMKSVGQDYSDMLLKAKRAYPEIQFI